MILTAKKLLGYFTIKNCKRQIKHSLGEKKVIKRKGNKLNAKWKGYKNLFNSWVRKKDTVI